MSWAAEVLLPTLADLATILVVLFTILAVVSKRVHGWIGGWIRETIRAEVQPLIQPLENKLDKLATNEFPHLGQDVKHVQERMERVEERLRADIKHVETQGREDRKAMEARILEAVREAAKSSEG